MDVAWVPPAHEYVKINSHCIMEELPSPNGNLLSVGIIMRDNLGVMLWAAMGPIPANDSLEAELKGIHLGLVKALNLNKRKSHIETDSRLVSESLRDQDKIILDETVEEVLRQINTIHANHFIPGITDRAFSCTLFDMNSVAVYLANQGLDHTTSFVEVPHPFGDLQRLLNIDMGIAFDFMIPNFQPNFGFGEVVNQSSPLHPAEVEEPHVIHEAEAEDAQVANFFLVNSPEINLSLNVLVNFVGPSGVVNQEEPLDIEKDLLNAMAKSKGKGKVLQGYSFNEDGLLSQEAIKYLDSGVLSQIAKGFSNEVIDLEVYVCKGIQLKDVLESAVCGTLREMKELIAWADMKSKGLDYGESSTMGAEFMDVEQVLMEMLGNEEGF